MSNSINFKIPAMRIYQREKDHAAIYTGKIKVRDLCYKTEQRFEIDLWKESQPENAKGYQRDPEELRVQKICDYVVRETDNPLFPTSVLVNCRNELEFKSISSDGNYGELHVTDTLYIVDGQHRIKAFQKLMSSENLELKREYGDYELPIIVMTGFNRVEEIEQFYIINHRQKKIPTNLAQQIYHSLALENYESGLIPETQRWTLTALTIAKALRSSDDYSDSIWYGRIGLPNESQEMAKHRLISQNSFITSLKPFFHGEKAIWPARPINEKRGDEIVKEGSELIYGFWKTLGKVYEKIFTSPNDYSLFKTVGVYSMHLFLLEVKNQNKRASNSELFEIIEQKLENAKATDFNENFWRTGNRLATMRGRNAAAYSNNVGHKTIARALFMGDSIV